jgi:mRNA interferase MazF
MRRGDVFAFRPRRDAQGHEQRGARLAVAVAADEFRWLSTVTVVPTSTSAEHAVFRPRVRIGRRSTSLLVDQVSTVDRSRVGRRVGRLGPADLRELDEALGLYLGLL